MRQRKEVLETVNGVNVREAIEGNPYLLEDRLNMVMTPARDNRRPYGDSRIVAMMQSMIDKVMFERIVSVIFEIRLRQAIDDMVSSTWYLVKVTEALLGTNEVLE